MNNFRNIKLVICLVTFFISSFLSIHILRIYLLSSLDVRFGGGVQEYHDNIGDLDGPEEKERAQAKIQKFISAL